MEILILNKYYIIEQYGVIYLFYYSDQFYIFMQKFLIDFFDINKNFFNVELINIDYKFYLLKVKEISLDSFKFINLLNYNFIEFYINWKNYNRLFAYSDLEIKNYIYLYFFQNLHELKYNWILNRNDNMALYQNSTLNNIIKFNYFNITFQKIKYYIYYLKIFNITYNLYFFSEFFYLLDINNYFIKFLNKNINYINIFELQYEILYNLKKFFYKYILYFNNESSLFFYKYKINNHILSNNININNYSLRYFFSFNLNNEKYINENYNNFWYKIQPFFFRSGIFLPALDFIPNTKGFSFILEKGIYKNEDLFYFFEHSDSYFLKVLKKYFIFDYKKQYNIDNLLLQKKYLVKFIIFNIFLKKWIYIYILNFFFINFFIIFFYYFFYYYYLNLYLFFNNLLKIFLIILNKILLFFTNIINNYFFYNNWFFLFSENVWNFYNTNIININFINFIYLWRNFNVLKFDNRWLLNDNFYNLNEQKNRFLFNMFINKILFIFLSFVINLYFFIKNSNKFFLYNIQFYFFYKYWTQEHIIRSTFLVRHVLDFLEFFKYLYFVILEHNIIIKLLSFFKKYINKKKIKKIYKKPNIGLARKFTIFTTFLIYIDGIFGNIRAPYYFLRKESYLDKILALGRVNSEIEYFSLLYFALEKEFFLFSEEILVGFLNFKKLFFWSDFNILGKQKPIIMLDYSILTFLYENNVDNILFYENNFKALFDNLKLKFLTLLLNNFFVYLFFFNYFSKFLKFEIFFKNFSFYFFNIFYFLYFLNLKNNFRYLTIYFLKYLKYFYFIFFYLNLYLKIFFEYILVKNKYIIIFFNILKKIIVLNLIILISYFFFNILIYDLLNFLNSILNFSIFENFIYLYYFFFELIIYIIEILFFKNILLFLSSIFFNLFYENGMIKNFFFVIDYNVLFWIWSKLLLNTQISLETFYSELTFGEWSKWADLYIPTNFLHAFFRLIFKFILINVQPLWFFFLRHWFFYTMNIYHGFFLVLWYPLVLMYYTYWSFYDLFCLNIYIFFFKCFFFFEFFFNWIIFLILKIFNNLFILLNDLINYSLFFFFYFFSVFYYILGFFYFILYYIYLNLYLYKIFLILKEILYSIFFIKIFLNFFTFLFNFFLFYSNQFYYNINIDFVKNIIFNFRNTFMEYRLDSSYYFDYGVNLNETFWSKNFYDRNILLNFFYYEWYNLEFFKTFYSFFFEINKSIIFFFLIYIFIIYRLFFFFFSWINKWYIFIYYNNDFSFFFTPYLNWENFNFFKKERSYYFKKDNRSILDLPLIYFFNSYNELDKMLYKKYEILLYNNKNFEFFQGRLREMEVYGFKKYINNTLKTKTKTYISNENHYPILNYDNIIRNIINLKKLNYFSFYVKTVYFFKNYQIFWYNYLNNFLYKMVDLHGYHSFFQLRNMHEFPLELNIDKYNQLFGPVEIYYPFFDEKDNSYQYGYDLITKNLWKDYKKKSIDILEKKNLLFLNMSYKLKNMLSYSNKKIIKDNIIFFFLKKPNKNLYFFNYLQYPFLYLFYNNDFLSNNHLKYLKYMFPFLVIKENNIYNKNFILDKMIFDKYNMICLGSIFISELKNFKYLKFIFFNTAIQSYNFFFESNYKRSWIFENNVEKILLNQFYHLSKWTRTHSIIIPSIFQYKIIKDFDVYMYLNYKFYNWLNFININYFNNYINIYKLSINKHSKDYGKMLLDDEMNNDSNHIERNKLFILNNDEYAWFNMLNQNLLKKDVDWNWTFEEKFKDYYEKFKSIELDSIFLTRFELDFEYHSNPLNMSIFFIFIYVPFQYFIDDVEVSWELEEFFIYLPEIAFNTYFDGYDAAVLNFGIDFDYEIFTWSHLFYNDFIVFINKFFNSFFNYELLHRNIDYIFQPFNSDFLLIDTEYRDDENRFDSSKFLNEDVMDDEICYPSDENYFHSLFKDLLVNKSLFYNENIEFFFINFFLVNLKYLFLFKNTFFFLIFENFYKNFLIDKNLLLNYYLYFLNNHLLINNYLNFYELINISIVSYNLNHIIEKFFWFDRFFFNNYFIEKKMIIMSSLLSSGEMIYKLEDSLLFFNQKLFNWHNMINYNLIIKDSIDFSSSNLLYGVSTLKFFNCLLPSFDWNWLYYIYEQNLQNTVSFWMLNDNEFKLYYIIFVLKKFIIFNYDILLKDLTFINNSFFFNKKEQNLWLLQWWLNNKEIYWNIFDLKNKNFNIINGILNFIYFFFMYFFLFSIIFLFFFKFKINILKKKVYYKKKIKEDGVNLYFLNLIEKHSKKKIV